MSHWYVARTKPRQEMQTSVLLAQRDIGTYLPLIHLPQRRAALVETELLFPGYLFVRLDLSGDDWLRARSAPGISYFLGGSEVPTSMPERLIDEIRERVHRRKPVRSSQFQRGERVTIVGGAFDGLEAIFEGELSGSRRSRVLVEIVARLVPVDVDASSLRPVR